MLKAAPGRPTPQKPRDDGGPGFLDRRDFRDDATNPYVRIHRDFGPELLTAEQAQGWRGRWTERLGTSGPLHVEVGTGNGEFVAALATANPGWRMVGIELRYKRAVLTATKLRKAGVSNAVVCRYHAAFLDDLFEPGSVDVVWLNHPDPWPKHSHDRNRLVSAWFLGDVARLLRPGGRFRMKTDFRGNVLRLDALVEAGGLFTTLGRAPDVTRGAAPWPDDVETNYQKKFRVRGLPVQAIELERR